jgi:hypothetical protein
MEPYRVSDHEQPEEQKVHVLQPAARACRQGADRMRHEAVVWPQQAMDEGNHGEDDRTCDTCRGQYSNH